MNFNNYYSTGTLSEGVEELTELNLMLTESWSNYEDNSFKNSDWILDQIKTRKNRIMLHLVIIPVIAVSLCTKFPSDRFEISTVDFLDLFTFALKDFEKYFRFMISNFF